MSTTTGGAPLHQELRRTGFELQHKQDKDLTKVELHHHDFYEIYFLTSGEVTCTIESRLYRATPGDILLISPRELHQLRILPEMGSYERFILWMTPASLRRLSSERTDLLQFLDPSVPGHRNQLHIPPEEQPPLYSLIFRLHQELHSNAFGDDLMAKSFLLQLLVALNRLAAKEELPEEVPGFSNPVVDSVVAYIGAHCGEPLTLDELAARFFVSKYHLSHEFSRLVGTSVHHYILKKRLLTARQRMAQGQHPGEVWEPCGFGDYSGFYRAFQSEYGMSPREYLSLLQSEPSDK